MGVSTQDRTDFLNMLDACRTEQQLFSRLTFAVMFHQTDPDAREDLLDDVRGAACNMQLPAVNYKIDQWLNTCKQAWQADPAAFMAAVNADAKQRKLALEGSAAQPGLLADVPMQSVAWLVPQLLPLGEVSLLGADGGTGKGIWQAQLIAYVTAGKTSGFFPLPPQQTGTVLLLAGEDDPGKVLKARLLAAGADMNRVLVLTADDYFGKTGQPLTLKDQALADFAAKAGPLLLIVDPLQSFLPADVEMASRNQMRSALLPLRAIAAKQGCAVLIVMHSNKKQGVSGRARLADSSDIWDMARSVLMMGRAKNDGKIYLSHEKNSYARPQQTVLLHIDDVEVEEILTPRVDVIAVEDDLSLDEVADTFAESGYSRLPVYHGTIDNIIGVVHEKDFYLGRLRKDTTLEDLVKPTLYTTGSTQISQLLRTLREQHHHMAVVVDEYGGTEGIITLEDILEELVGEIWDEHDEATEDFRKQSDGSWIVLGSAGVDDLYERLGLPEDEDIDSNTVNGLVQEKTCHLPKVGDRFTLGEYDGVVTRTAKRRVTEVRLTPAEKPEPKKEEDEKPHFNRLTNK